MQPRAHFTEQDQSIRNLHLADAQMLFIEGHPGARVRVLSGGLWVTEPGRAVARFVRPPEEVSLVQRGGLVLEGVGHCTVEVAQPLLRWTRGALGHRATLRRNATRLLANGLVLAVALAIGVGAPEMLARGLQKTGDATSVAVAGAASQAPARV